MCAFFKPFTKQVQKLGFGFYLLVVAATMLSLISESRQIINLTPFIIVPLCMVLDTLALRRAFIAQVFAISLLLSKVWLPINATAAMLGFAPEDMFQHGKFSSPATQLFASSLVTIAANPCYLSLAVFLVAVAPLMWPVPFGAAQLVRRRKLTKFRQIDLHPVRTQWNSREMPALDHRLSETKERQIKLHPLRTQWNSREMPALDYKLSEDKQRKIQLLPPRTQWNSQEMPALDHKLSEDKQRQIKMYPLRTQWNSREMPALKPVEKPVSTPPVEPPVTDEDLVQSST